MSEPDAAAAGGRVTTLELFFDLVFVFTVTQLTTTLVDGPQPRALIEVVLMLGVIFWMYGGYAWLTNSVALDRLERRLLLLGGMAGFLVIALAIPTAFAGGGLTFGLAYLVVVGVHTTLYTKAASERSRAAILRVVPYNLCTASLVLAAGAVGGDAEYALWGLAFALEWVTPVLAGTGRFDLDPAHFVERHGLVVIVAIGESIVAIGIGASDLPLDAKLVAVAGLGLLLSVCLWWTYFGRDDDVAAEHALRASPPERRGPLAIHAFGYCHLALLLGIIAVAAGIKKAVGHPFDALELEAALELGGGAALFMAGDILFRRALGLGRGPWRGIAAAGAALTIPLGSEGSAVLQLTALVIVLAAALTADARLSA